MNVYMLTANILGGIVAFMDQFKKIAIFTDTYLPGVGGTEKALKYMSDALENLGYKTRIYAPRYPDQNDDPKVFRVNGVQVHPTAIMALPFLFRSWEKDLREFDPDIIHFCSASGMAKAAVYASKKLCKPLVATVHTKYGMAFDDTVKVKPVVKFMLYLCARRLEAASRVSVVSKSQIEDLKSYGFRGNNIEVIYNGGDFSSARAAEKCDVDLIREKYGIKRSHVFIFVGRLEKYKNTAFTLNCLKAVKDSGYDDFQFVVVGNGACEKRLKKQAIKLGLAENVIFTGLIKDKKELTGLYSASTLFILPSVFDNDPLVISEAALNGSPSLVLENTGSSERIKDGVNGYTAPFNEQDFAAKIIYIMNDGHYEDVKSNVETIIPESWQDVAKNYVKFYLKAFPSNKES